MFELLCGSSGLMGFILAESLVVLSKIRQFLPITPHALIALSSFPR